MSDKVVILTSNAFWPSIGGIENSLRHLAYEAEKSGDRFIVVVSDVGIRQGDRKQRIERFGRGYILRYPHATFKVSFLRFFNIVFSSVKCFFLLKKLESRFKKKQVVVIARYHINALISKLVGFKRVKYLVPSVISKQVVEEFKGQNFLKRLKMRAFILLHSYLQKLALLNSDVFVFSNTMATQCKELTRNENLLISLVKPGVDGARFSYLDRASKATLKAKLGFPSDKPLILFVGRFVAAKQVELLIEAFCKYCSVGHLALVGDGVRKGIYKDMASNYDQQDSISIIPPSQHVENFYRAADVFIMSSSYEPLGQTILEALASGLSVVAFSHFAGVNTATEELGMNEFIEFCDHNSSYELANSINSVIFKLDSFESKHCSEKALSLFSWKNLYLSLLKYD